MELQPVTGIRPYHSKMVDRKWFRKVIASVVCLSLGVSGQGVAYSQFVSSPPGGGSSSSGYLGAQPINLPRLGDAADEDLPLSIERKIGEEIYRDYLASGEVLEDGEITDYVWQVASKLTRTASANGFDFTFFVVRDPRINAFALPGGYIGVNTGLIAASNSESELASVLAHEIAHITQRHIARMLAKQKQASILSLASLVIAALAARSNPQAAFGALSLGDALQTGNLLSFSRDAEREADRLGFDMLTQAGFDPAGMSAFFSRLQQANRFNESRAPEYLRTHPLTQDRISDAQLRAQALRYRQRVDSLDFVFARAKLQAGLNESIDAVTRARKGFELALRDKTTNNELGAWYGLGYTAMLSRDFPLVDKTIAEIRKRIPAGGGHPMVEQLAIESKIRAAAYPQALFLAEQASTRYPQSRPLGATYASTLLYAGKIVEAKRYLEEQTGLYKTDQALWALLAKAYDANGQPALAHKASAERYLLLGASREAANQLDLAQKAGGVDFYVSSQIDARLREVRQTVQREQAERQAARR
jgi:beta-barrel assembly-enhancing protease